MTRPPSEQTAIPHCYRHPNREALVRCTRCDRPICPDCMREASVGFHCPDDVAAGKRTVRTQRTSVGAVLRSSPPYATGTIVGLNIVAYVVTGLQSTSGITNPQNGGLHSLFYAWQLQPIAVYQDNAYWRLLTSAFLHVSLLHIGANMLSLIIIGPVVERLLGPLRFVSLYLLAALGGSAAIYVFGSQYEAVVGASGAIFGLFAACLVMVRRLGLDLQWLVGIIVLNFVFTFSVTGISRLAHLGGFVVGGVAALAIGGLPRMRGRVPGRIQAGGLLVILGLVVVAVALRSAFGDFPG